MNYRESLDPVLKDLRTAVGRQDTESAKRHGQILLWEIQRAWTDSGIGIDTRVSDTFHLLAETYGADGAYGVMARSIEDARLSQRNSGKESPAFANHLIRLALLYRALAGMTGGVGECFYAAEQNSNWDSVGLHLFASATRIRRKALGPLHPLVADSLELSARFPVKSDFARKLSRGPSVYEQALEIREKALGADHLDVAKALELCSNSESLRRSLDIRKRVLGSEHPLVAQSMEHLANHMFFREGLKVEAESLLNQAITVREKLQGPNHPDLADALYGLYTFYDWTNDVIEAQSVLDRVIEIVFDVNAVRRNGWHDGQELFEFLLPPTEQQFAVYDRISVTEEFSQRITFPTTADANQKIVQQPVTADAVLSFGQYPAQPTTLSRLAHIVSGGYDLTLDNAPDLPPECYDIEGLTDPFRYGSVPEGWIDRFSRFKQVITEYRLRESPDSN